MEYGWVRGCIIRGIGAWDLLIRRGRGMGLTVSVYWFTSFKMSYSTVDGISERGAGERGYTFFYCVCSFLLDYPLFSFLSELTLIL